MQIRELGLADLAAALSSKQVSALEVAQAYCDRHEAIDANIRAFIYYDRAWTETQAREADAKRARGDRAPLLGIPLTVKDNLELVGTPTTVGTVARKDQRATQDSVVVGAVRAAGAVFLGKTNVPQTLLAMESTNRIVGATVNPYDAERTCGGSSGGEAAAIATGQSIAGLGTDIGGSIRTPAAYCGVAGLKPTLNRWSNRGSIGAMPGQEFIRGQCGPMARSVRDLIWLWEHVEPRVMAATDGEVPPLPSTCAPPDALRGMRIGYYDYDGYLMPSTSVRRAVRESVEHLRSRGAELIPVPVGNAQTLYPLIVAGLTSDGMRTISAFLQGEAPIEQVAKNGMLAKLPRVALKQLERGFRIAGETRVANIIAGAGRKSIDEYWALCKARLDAARHELDVWNEHRIDALICPGTATPAPQHGATSDFTIATVYTMRYNLTNLPAGVVYAGRVQPGETKRELSPMADHFDKRAASVDAGSEGLPVAVQVVARPYREDHVLAVMLALEERLAADTSREQKARG